MSPNALSSLVTGQGQSLDTSGELICDHCHSVHSLNVTLAEWPDLIVGEWSGYCPWSIDRLTIRNVLWASDADELRRALWDFSLICRWIVSLCRLVTSLEED
ncbi:hypothetical protein BaRGS_00003151 [Batillaria attramentaria]|uniref:Uncharacterized protein n=1 Tax=Batillaria attramentaria TaxID=370345 RepID=A0ABD0M133_9CAEN